MFCGCGSLSVVDKRKPKQTDDILTVHLITRFHIITMCSTQRISVCTERSDDPPSPPPPIPPQKEKEIPDSSDLYISQVVKLSPVRHASTTETFSSKEQHNSFIDDFYGSFAAIGLNLCLFWTKESRPERMRHRLHASSLAFMSADS